MMEDPRAITRATYLLWVDHNIERIGDRVCNIAERTIFMVTGVPAERTQSCRGISGRRPPLIRERMGGSSRLSQLLRQSAP